MVYAYWDYIYTLRRPGDFIREYDAASIGSGVSVGRTTPARSYIPGAHATCARTVSSV